MEALIADSPTVPGLLTEYILKGENQLKLVFHSYCSSLLSNHLFNNNNN